MYDIAMVVGSADVDDLRWHTPHVIGKWCLLKAGLKSGPKGANFIAPVQKNGISGAKTSSAIARKSPDLLGF
jgi:hypothetical protein